MISHSKPMTSSFGNVLSVRQNVCRPDFGEAMRFIFDPGRRNLPLILGEPHAVFHCFQDELERPTLMGVAVVISRIPRLTVDDDGGRT